ncbi:MAG: hypothetical protein FWD26_07035 [Treponema sp.]|nr:hypothetical protein [Treponema sp.]
MKKLTYVLFISVLLLTFNSCIGLSIDIQMNRDGSGRLTMEYRISRMIENLGALDGNEKWPTIPVGRADWERTIQRINGAKIVSFSSRERGQDTITNIVLEYDSEKTLLAILDPSGKRSSINDNRFEYIMLDDSPVNYDAALMEMAKNMFADYNFSISFSAPGNSTLTITDAQGKPAAPPPKAQIVPAGRRVSMSIGIMELLNIPNGLGVIFSH